MNDKLKVICYWYGMGRHLEHNLIVEFLLYG